MSEELRSSIGRGDREAALDAASAMAAGGGGDALADAVVEMLVDGSPWMREEALALLRALTPDDALLERLTEALASGAHPDRRNAARSALAAMASPEARDPAAPLPRLTSRLLNDPDVDVRILAANALGESHNPRAREALERALADPAANVVAAAAEALGALNDPRAVDALVALAERRDFWTGSAAVVALGQLDEPRAVSALSGLTSDPWLAAEAARALGRVGDARALEPLRDMIAMPPEAREAAIDAAAEIVLRTGSDNPEWLRNALAEKEEALLRRFDESGDADAARRLGLAGTERAAEALLDHLQLDPDGAASVGLAVLPEALRVSELERRLPGAPPEVLPVLLAILPPLGSAAAIESVAALLTRPESEVRAAAAEALGRSAPDLVLPVLEARRGDPAARLGVALAYGRMGDQRCTPLLEMLRDPDPRVRAAAAEGTGRCGLATIDELTEALRREDDPAAVRALIRAMGNEGGERAVEELLRVLASDDAAMRFEAVRALGCTASPAAFRPLLDALADPDPGIRTVALSALGELGDRRASEPLSRHMDDPDRDRRRIAAAALERLYGAESTALLESALADPDRELRLLAVKALARLRLSGTLQRLERMAEEDPDPLVRHTAAAVAARLQDRVEEVP